MLVWLSSFFFRSRSLGKESTVASKSCVPLPSALTATASAAAGTSASTPPAAVFSLISLSSSLMRASTFELSSMASGKGRGAFFFQNESCSTSRSYVLAPPPSDTVTRFILYSSTSSTRAWYVQVCWRTVAKSNALSKMTTRGLAAVTVDPDSKKGPPAPPDHACATRSLSCRATISEGPLRGARMMGMAPRVATTEKRP
mmetsp:Transcript_47436/g.95583  ORF Transcript_47436/g.95583 Transcript_47436/m.95583 type:complete len:200 (+) Transcript_47436:288-887(+)